MNNKPGPIYIIIPAFNQLTYCRLCIESIQANTYYPYHLILVDNGSTDGVAEYFDSIPNATLIHNKTNRGFAAAINQGIACAKGPVLLLNSDTIVPPGWLKRLKDALYSADDIGAVGPYTNNTASAQQIEDPTLESVEALPEVARLLAQKNKGQVLDVARLTGFCFLIREEVIREVGLWDEEYGIGNFEDDDYCLRILRAGYRLCIAEDVYILHFGECTFRGMGIVDEKFRALIERNEEIFWEKQRATPEERSNQVQQAKQYIKQAQQLLEKGDFSTVLTELKKAVACEPHYYKPYQILAELLLDYGNLEKALEYAKRAILCSIDDTKSQRLLFEIAEKCNCLTKIQEWIQHIQDSPAKEETR